MDYYATHFFPYWRCEKCGKRYYALENYCFFCNKKKPRPMPPPRHQYREIGEMPYGREYYLGSVDLDDWRER